MIEKQLNVWIAEDLKNYIAERAEQERRGMNAVVSDLIREDLARRKGGFIQNNSLAVLQQMLTAEIHQTHAQLRQDLQADRQQEAASLQEFLKKQVDRLAGLTVHSIRNGGITRRLVYTLISKAYSPQFAKSAYDNAVEKANQELVRKKAPAEEHMLIEEDHEAV